MLRPVIESLDAESSTDIALASPITSRLVHLLKKPKKYELSMVSLFIQIYLVFITYIPLDPCRPNLLDPEVS